MTKTQRYRYEMFVRVRDFGRAHSELFAESSTGGKTFAHVAAAVAAIDDHMKNRVVAKAEARRGESATREAVFSGMKTIAKVARRVTRGTTTARIFVMPRRRSFKVELATAKAFAEQAEKRQEQFLRFGLPPVFVSDFSALVNELQQTESVRLSSKTLKRQAQEGIREVIKDTLNDVRDLDALVEIAMRHDPVSLAAYDSARRIEGQGSSKKASAVKVPEQAIAPVAETAPADASAAGDPVVALVKAS